MANKKDPAFLFYPSDFIIGTSMMTFEQKGKYIHLLCLQHLKENRLSEDEFQFICENDKLIESKFIIEDGFRINIRLKDEIEKRRKYCNSRNNNLRKEPSKETTDEVQKIMPKIEEKIYKW